MKEGRDSGWSFTGWYNGKVKSLVKSPCADDNSLSLSFLKLPHSRILAFNASSSTSLAFSKFRERYTQQIKVDWACIHSCPCLPPLTTQALRNNFWIVRASRAAINQANFLRTLMNLRASPSFGSSHRRRSSQRKPKMRCKIFETFTAWREGGCRKCEVCANLESYLQGTLLSWYP